ncbi:hypothetical protein BCR34DRAFT_375762 [Clohesyomyces aquaticus]|uniref:Uncharacterized protein n=1 Tax=Clohesyomyces aquaticus TaxID=1231657 RepID=A0A1Y1ZGT7_9PLEO|nr:hypothetical protein BCR34DRAFT_375762 [Clohesyomyces aquaticus]
MPIKLNRAHVRFPLFSPTEQTPQQACRPAWHMLPTSRPHELVPKVPCLASRIAFSSLARVAFATDAGVNGIDNRRPCFHACVSVLLHGMDGNRGTERHRRCVCVCVRARRNRGRKGDDLASGIHRWFYGTPARHARPRCQPYRMISLNPHKLPCRARHVVY